MKILQLLSVVITGLLLYSCTQDDPPATTLQKLQGYWTYEKDITHDSFPSFPGGSHWDTTYLEPGDYLDFRTDGLVYKKTDTELNTYSYSIIGDSKIIFTHTIGGYSDTFDIVVLNDHQFQIYIYQYIGPGDTHRRTEYYTR